MNKLKLQGAWWGRALNMVAGVACLAVTAGAGLDASTLWNNGAVQSFNGSLPNDTTNAPSTVFDNFTVGAPGWIVSGFDITDFFVGASTSEYSSTNWSLWKGNPLSGGTLVASGSSAGSVGTASGNCSSQCSAMITVTLSSGVFLASSSSQYYLGTSDVLKNTNGSIDVTERAFAAGNGAATAGWEESNGSIVGSSWVTCPTCTSTTNPTGDTAFDILGSLAPEPGTMLLMGLALAGLGYKARRRTV